MSSGKRAIVAAAAPAASAAAVAAAEVAVGDIYELFSHYNKLYFGDALGACVVSWSSAPPMKRCTGTCDCDPEGGCEIRLSEPLLAVRSDADLKNTLLHEMIHAFMWIKNGNRDHSDHKAAFLALMDAINSSTLLDRQKPLVGYRINVNHKFTKEADNMRGNHWTCESCGHSFCRTMRGDPSVNDCISNVKQEEYCGYPVCQWHRHRKYCSGKYIRKQAGVPDSNYTITTYTETELQKDKFKGIYYTRSSARRSCTKRNMDGSKAIITIKISSSADDTNGSPGCESYGNGSQRKHMFDDSDSVSPTVECLAMIPAIPKRTRTSVSTKKPPSEAIPIKNTPSTSNVKRNSGCIFSQKEQKIEDSKCPPPTNQCLALIPAAAKRKQTPASVKKPMDNGRKRKKCGERKDYNVIIKWLDLYTDEEDEEDEGPLTNKRTERRKKMWLLECQAKQQEREGTSYYGEIPVLSGDKMEECECPKDMAIARGPKKIQADEDIVYISD